MGRRKPQPPVVVDEVPALEPDESTDLWELQRRAAFRTFRVTMIDGSKRTIIAHSWENHSPGGHLNFITTSPEGMQQIRNSIAGPQWAEVLEIPDAVAHIAYEDMAKHHMTVSRMQIKSASSKLVH